MDEAATSMLLLDYARELAPIIQAHAAEAERLRRLPEPVLGELKAAGFFRMWLPKEVGGYELPPAGTMRVVEELARSDGSTGWCVMVAAQNALFLSGFEQSA